jgi:MFS family permease
VTPVSAAAGSVSPLYRYLLGAGLARLAVEGNATALVLLVLDRTGSAHAAGALLSALLGPSMLAGPVSGALLDRTRHRRRAYTGALGVLAACIGSLSVLVGPRLTAPAVLVAVLGGCVLTVVSGGLSSLVADLAAGRPVLRAYGLDSTAYSTASVAGPSVAALLSGLAGPALAVQVSALLIALGTVLVATLPLPPVAAERPSSGILRQTGTGLLAMLRSRPLAVLTSSSTLAFVGFGPVALATALAASSLGHARSAGGLAVSAFAAGALAGSAVMAARSGPPRRPERLVLASLALTGCCLLLAALAPSFWVLVGLFACAGLCNGPGLVTTFSVRAESSPPGMRTQVFTTAASLKGTAAAAGSALGGVVAGLGSATLLVTMGSLHLVGALAGVVVAALHPDRAEGT